MQEKANQTYEHFVLRLINNEELDFEYKGIVYSIIHDPPYVNLYINVTFRNQKYESEGEERFSSIFQLLDAFMIEGKKIRDIWDEIALLS